MRYQSLQLTKKQLTLIRETLKSFAKFTGKLLWRRLFSNKVAESIFITSFTAFSLFKTRSYFSTVFKCQKTPLTEAKEKWNFYKVNHNLYNDVICKAMTCKSYTWSVEELEYRKICCLSFGAQQSS